MKMDKKLLAIQIAVAIIILALTGSPAFGAGTGPLVQVSGASPFGPIENCGDFPGTLNGTNFVASEVGPRLEVNPTNPDHMVAIWQQDSWSDGGSRGNVAGVSFDGGATWAIVPIPGITDCTGGPWERASDPWVSFGPDGTVHQMSSVFQTDPPPNASDGFGPNGMVVSKSEDGGLTWSNPITIVEDNNPRFFNENNSLTADPTDANFVYAVWDKVDVPPGLAGNPNHAVSPGFKSAAMFTRSSDGGDTWEPPRILYGPGGTGRIIGSRIVVLPNGTVINFFNEMLSLRNDDGGSQSDFNLSFKYSLNKGETWLPHGQPIRTNKMEGIGTVTPDDLTPVRDGFLLFDVAVDPENGNLYVVWQDARFDSVNEIAFSQSSDDGYTWSAPIKVNQTPPTPTNPLRAQAFLPSIAVNGNGTLSVTYYDFRNDDGAGELADYFSVSCVETCSDPTNWGGELRLTDASFDISTAPYVNGLFLGDHMGLASAATADFRSFFVQSSAGDPANGFFRRVSP
jgi:hypothetical protein